MSESEPGIDWLSFQRKHSKNALVNAAQRLAAYETLERFDAKCKFTQRERAFAPQTSRP